jgi:hypothetical protein
MSNAQLKQELLASSYFDKYVRAGKDVIMVVIGGSRSTGIVDERSDFDIRVITAEDQDEVPHEALKWNGKRVHWYYNSIKQIFNLEGKSSIDKFGLGLTWRIDLDNPDDIIYKNPVHQPLIDFIIRRKHDISKFYFYSHFESLADYIDILTSSIYIRPEHYSKAIYQLCLSYYYLTGKQYDAEFLSSIKRISKNPTTAEQRLTALDYIRELKKFITDNPMSPTFVSDIQEELSQLL